MKRRFDLETAANFSVTIAGLITRIGDPLRDPTPNLIFSCGIQNSPRFRDEVESEARGRGKSVVYLEFALGKERKGPVTVAVLHLAGDEPAAWRDCALWSPANGGSILVAKNGSASFEIRGVDLVSAAPPPRKLLQSGFVRGRRKLAAAAKLMKGQRSDVIADVERAAFLHPPSPEEHRIATARRLAAMSAAPGRTAMAGGMPPWSGPDASMKGNPGGEPSFMLDMTDEILLTFLAGRTAHPSGHDEILLTMRVQPGDLMDFMVWLGDRRDQWRDWRDHADASGVTALGEDLGAHWKETVEGPPDQFDVDIHPDWMGVDFVVEFPGRTAVIASHRFAGAEDAEAFRVRYLQTENITRWALFEAACLLRRRDLARLIATVLERGSVLDERDAKHAPTIH